MNIAHQTDIKVRWLFVDKDNNEMDFTPVKHIKVLIRHSRYVNTTYEPRSLSIVNGKINFEIPAEDLRLPGIYHAEMTGVWQTEDNSDGDQKLFVRYLGAFSISNMGCSCHHVKLTSRICLENCLGSQSVNILNSRWGDIVGNIQDQDDLMALFDSTKHLCQWGQISGDVLEQGDLVELVRYLVKKYGGSESSGNDGNGSDTFSILASSNNTTMGTVSPTIKTVEKGDSLTITATAKTGYYILSWDEVADVVFSGVGNSTGQAYIANAQRDMTIKCNFAPMPDWGIAPTSITLDSSGTIVDDIVLFTENGCTIQGATSNNEGSYKLIWGNDQDDYLTIGFETSNVIAGSMKVWVKSTKNTLDGRTKSIVFVENNTDRTVSLNVIQSKITTYTVSGSVYPSAAGSLQILKTDTDPGFTVNFVPNTGYGMSGDSDGIFDVSFGEEVLLTKAFTYQTNTPVNRNYTLLVRASQAPSLRRYKLTTSTAGTGSGTINVSPSSTDGYYNEKTFVFLSVNEVDGSTFSHWMINGQQLTDRYYTPLMTLDIIAIAYFEKDEDPGTPEPNYYTVTLSCSEYYGGADAGTLTGAGTYKEGDTVVISATPTPGNGKQFSSWTGDLSSFQNPHSFLITKNMDIIATFSNIPQSQYTLTLQKNISAGGTVSGAGVYNSEVNAEILATPAQGYKFTHWSGAVTQGWQSGNPLTVRMDSDRTITANFEAISPNVVNYNIKAIDSGTFPQSYWPQDAPLMAGGDINGDPSRQVFGGTYRHGDYPVTGTFTKNDSDTYLELHIRLGYYRFGNGTTTAYNWQRPELISSISPDTYDDDSLVGEINATYKLPFTTDDKGNVNVEIEFRLCFYDPYARNE